MSGPPRLRLARGSLSSTGNTSTPDAEVPPTNAIRAYVEALLDRWIDMTEEDVDDISPWADGPLINNASGPIIYFAMRPSMADEVSAAAARMAVDRGLVCFDPQRDCLRPTADEPLGR